MPNRFNPHRFNPNEFTPITFKPVKTGSIIAWTLIGISVYYLYPQYFPSLW